MNKPENYVVFTIDNQSYALNLTTVERVISAAEVTPLPEAPEAILGVVNIHGRIITVINTRKYFNLPARELDPKDKFVLILNAKRIVALVVDDVTGIMGIAVREIISAKEIQPGMENVEGIIKQDGNIIYMLNPEKLLSFMEGT